MFDERSLRDVRFVAKCREVGLSLKTIGEVLPSYRTGKLTYDQMIELMNTRILEVEQQIAEQHRIRKELMAASAWFEKQKREAAERDRHEKSGPSPWPIRRKYSQ